jgi:hypothetical protein
MSLVKPVRCWVLLLVVVWSPLLLFGGVELDVVCVMFVRVVDCILTYCILVID